MNYTQVIKYLNSLERFGIQLGLERITNLLELVGNPHKDLKCIHIAGTNGKGSVTTFIGEILKNAGFKVGIYTSPHFISFTERITINGIPIRELEVAEIISKEILPAINILTRPSSLVSHPLSHPTYFEIATALAFIYFAREKVDFAVIEVGLGGRLDATNVITPLVSVITSINLDHQDVLGDSLEKIAYEKAGIIKQGVPVVTAVTQSEVVKVIEKIALQKNSILYRVGGQRSEDRGQKTEDRGQIGNTFQSSVAGIRCSEKIRNPNKTEVSFVVDKYNSHYQFNVKGILKEYHKLRTSLLGYHQVINAVTSIGAIEVLGQHYGIKITTQAIKKGLLQAKIRGRLELIKNKFLLDGAHNPASANVLRKALEDYYSTRRLIFVIGILEDKDISGIVKELLYQNKNISRVIITHPKTNRAAKTEQIYQTIIQYTDKIDVFETVREGIKYAESIASSDDLICITGSLYTVGEAIEFLEFTAQTRRNRKK